MNKKLFNWLLFLVLSFIWGSSFILMKEGLKELSAYEVAAMRMLSAGVILLPFAIKAFRQIQRKDLGLIIVTGLLGSFIPAILFCLAETKIDSAVAGMLNALTPLFVITVGAAFFHSSIQWKKLFGVLIGFSGMLILFFSKAGSTGSSNLFFASLILIATFCYGLNVNLISHKLSHIGSLNIAAVAFVSLIIPSLIVLFVAGYFQHQFSSTALIRSTSAAAVLGVFGTAIASVLFYMLMKRAGALFSSMVTYGVPFVAVAWGIYAGEMINLMQMVGLCVILLGVYLANRQ